MPARDYILSLLFVALLVVALNGSGWLPLFAALGASWLVLAYFVRVGALTGGVECDCE